MSGKQRRATIVEKSLAFAIARAEFGIVFWSALYGKAMDRGWCRLAKAFDAARKESEIRIVEYEERLRVLEEELGPQR